LASPKKKGRAATVSILRTGRTKKRGKYQRCTVTAWMSTAFREKESESRLSVKGQKATKKRRQRTPLDGKGQKKKVEERGPSGGLK